MYQKFVNYAPFFMLVYSGISGFMSSLEVYVLAFRVLPDLIGYSIFTNLLMLKIYNPKRYCKTTRLAVYGLIAMNLINLLNISTRHYNPIYDTYIMIIVLCIVKYYNISKK